ncbi:MAG: Na+/H+ antiporter NhaC family protein [Planctomycetales bacterium]|nr:Na+/H+ antiporter NhaC family protein [Planctomycetales bacterium]
MIDPSPVGWLCLVPPLLTILMAIVTRRVVVSLLIGIATAVLILLPSPSTVMRIDGSHFSWTGYLKQSVEAFWLHFAVDQLWESLWDPDHLHVFAFTTFLGVQVALINASGGMLGVVRWASPFARTRRGGQILTWFLGLLIFIDDYANTLLLGSTMRPVTDRLKISREKLAFLVDTTAAPVSGLALVSTWVATEIGTMQAGFLDAGLDIGTATFGIFLQTIPSRFYVLFALAFVLLCGLLNRDFGPMLTAERKAQKATQIPRSDVSNMVSHPRAFYAVLPILVTVFVTVALLVKTGLDAIGDAPLPTSRLQAAGEIIGQGSSYVALLYGALSGLGVILILITWNGVLDNGQIARGLLDGFLHVLPAMIILWLAWSLSSLTGNEHMRTGQYLANKVVEADVPIFLLPTLIFVLAAGIAFSTGTSWGTMAIVMPIVIPLAHNLISKSLGIAAPLDHDILVATIGSVLAGAIFGDHCSPISDTTILSSRGSSCDHIAHVRTQLPYALTIAAVAIFCGTLPIGLGVPSTILLPAGVIVMLLILLIVGRRADQPLTCNSSPTS